MLSNTSFFPFNFLTKFVWYHLLGSSSCNLMYNLLFKVVEAGSDESLSANEDSPKRVRHDALTRRPSYRKILNDIAGCLVVYLFYVTKIQLIVTVN